MVNFSLIFNPFCFLINHSNTCNPNKTEKFSQEKFSLVYADTKQLYARMNTFETKYAEIRTMPPFEQVQRMAKYRICASARFARTTIPVRTATTNGFTVLPEGVFFVSISN